jgi:hypothetical protein
MFFRILKRASAVSFFLLGATVIHLEATPLLEPSPLQGEDKDFLYGPPNNWAFEFSNTYEKRQPTFYDIPGIIVFADDNWIIKNEKKYSALSKSTSDRAESFALHIFDSKTLKHLSTVNGPNFVRHVSAIPNGGPILALVGEYVGEDPAIIGPRLALLAISPETKALELKKVNIQSHFITTNGNSVTLNTVKPPPRGEVFKFDKKPFSELTISASYSNIANQIEDLSATDIKLDSSRAGLEFLESKFETTSLIGSSMSGDNNYQAKYEIDAPVINVRASNDGKFIELQMARQKKSTSKKDDFARFNALTLSSSKIDNTSDGKKLIDLDENGNPLWNVQSKNETNRYYWYNNDTKNKVEAEFNSKNSPHIQAGFSIYSNEKASFIKVPFQIEYDQRYNNEIVPILFSQQVNDWVAFAIKTTSSEYFLASLGLCNLKTGEIFFIDSKLDASLIENGELRVFENEDKSVSILYSSFTETALVRIDVEDKQAPNSTQWLDPDRKIDSFFQINPPMRIAKVERIARWPAEAKIIGEGREIFIKNQDGFTAFKISRDGNASKLFDIYLNSNGEYAIATQNGLFAGSPGSEVSILSQYWDTDLSPTVLSVWRNRPAEVLKALAGDPVQIEVLSKVTERWLKKLGNPERNPEPSAADIPTLSLSNEVPLWAKGEQVSLKFTAKPGTAPVKEVVVRVNGVDQQRGANSTDGESEIERTIKLAEGQNWIEAVGIDEKGRNSNLLRFRTILPEASAPAKRFVIAMGVSTYRESSMNLEFAAKDAADLSNAIKASTNGPSEVLLLTNDHVTRESLHKIRAFLANATENDEVVAFCAGHGVLNSNLDYVYASHEFDSGNPTATGIKLDDLVDAIGSSKSLKRLLLLDTCHAGQVGEKEEMLLAQMDTNLPSGVRAVKQRGMSVKPVTGLSAEGHQRFIEEMFLLPGLHRGINIIGASGGAEFALESAKWNNGVFTATIIEALRDKKADLNGDARISVGELRDFLGQRVSELTKGSQKPSVVASERDQDFDLIRAAYKRPVHSGAQATLRDESAETSDILTPTIPKSDSKIWLFPDSSENLLSAQELASLSLDDLWRARNEIFARHGFIFKSDKGKALVAALGANYSPVSSDQDGILAKMNPIEKANIKMIKQLEK